jgi:hypothetical protein
MSTKSANFSVRLRQDHLDALREHAAREDRSVNYILGRAIAEYLQRHPLPEEPPPESAATGPQLPGHPHKSPQGVK